MTDAAGRVVSIGATSVPEAAAAARARWAAVPEPYAPPMPHMAIRNRIGPVHMWRRTSDDVGYA